VLLWHQSAPRKEPIAEYWEQTLVRTGPIERYQISIDPCPVVQRSHHRWQKRDQPDLETTGYTQLCDLSRETQAAGDDGIKSPREEGSSRWLRYDHQFTQHLLPLLILLSPCCCAMLVTIPPTAQNSQTLKSIQAQKYLYISSSLSFLLYHNMSGNCAFQSRSLVGDSMHSLIGFDGRHWAQTQSGGRPFQRRR